MLSNMKVLSIFSAFLFYLYIITLVIVVKLKKAKADGCSNERRSIPMNRKSFYVQKIREIFNRQSTRSVCPTKVLRTITLSATTLAVLAMPTVISSEASIANLENSGNHAYVASVNNDVIVNPKELNEFLALTTQASVVTTKVTTTSTTIVTTTTTKATTTEDVEDKTDNNYQEEDNDDYYSESYDDDYTDDYEYDYYDNDYDYYSEETYDTGVNDTDSNSYYDAEDYDRQLLAEITCHEYGADWVPVEEKAKIVAAVINRVESDDYPDSVYDVLMQDGQFHGSWDGGYGYWPGEVDPNQGSYDAVDYYFEHQDEYSDDYTSWSGDGYANYFY